MKQIFYNYFNNVGDEIEIVTLYSWQKWLI